MAVRAGALTVTAPQAVVTLSLGADAAAKWKKKLEEPPKRLIDKLDVKPSAKVWLFDIDDTTLIAQVEERTDAVARGKSATACDVVFVDVDSEKELARIARAIEATKDDGAVWVIHRKGAAGVADTSDLRRGEGAWARLHQGCARLGSRHGRKARSTGGWQVEESSRA